MATIPHRPSKPPEPKREPETLSQMPLHKAKALLKNATPEEWEELGVPKEMQEKLEAKKETV